LKTNLLYYYLILTAYTSWSYSCPMLEKLVIQCCCCYNWSIACINWVSRKRWIWENRHWSCGQENG